MSSAIDQPSFRLKNGLEIQRWITGCGIYVTKPDGKVNIFTDTDLERMRSGYHAR